MKISELLTFMNEHGGAKAFMFYWEVADECEDIQFGAEDSEVSADDMEHYIQDGEPSPIVPVTDVTRTVMYPIKTVNGKLYGIVQGKKKDHIVYCPGHWEKGKTISVYGYWWMNSTLFGALDRLDNYLREAGIKCEVLADYVLVTKNDRKNNIRLAPKPMAWLNRIGSIPVPVQLYEEWW